MIKVKRLIKEIHDVETITPRDIFNLYYLEYMTSQHPEISQTPYGKETVRYYLRQLKQKYVKLFSKLLYAQLVKYLQRARIDYEFDKSKLVPDAPTKDLRDLMNHTFRSDMQRRNIVWNAVGDYTYGLDTAATPASMFVNINGLNNAVHNTGGKIIDDPGKVPNYRELRNAFNTADNIRNQNQWELLKGMVDKDIRDLMNQESPPEEVGEIIGKEYPPPRQRFDDSEEELNVAAKQPFTAWEYALRFGPHPKLWNIIKGSAYRKLYINKFGPQ